MSPDFSSRPEGDRRRNTIWRILSYTRNYKKGAAFAVLFLTGGMIARLLSPLFIQTVVDRYILNERYRVPQELWESFERRMGYAGKESPLLFLGDYYVKQDQFSQLKKVSRASLEEVPWILFERQKNEKFTSLLDRHKDQIVLAPTRGVVRKSDFLHLPIEDRRILRYEDYRGIGKSITLFLLVLLLALFSAIFRAWATARLGERVSKDIRSYLFSHVLNQSMGALGKIPVGSLVSRISSDVETMCRFFHDFLFYFVEDLLLIAGAVFLLFALSIPLAVITLITLIPVVVFMLFFNRVARRTYEKVRQEISNMNAFLAEYLEGMEVVQSFAQEKNSQKKFDGRNRKFLTSSLAEVKINAIFYPLVHLFMAVSLSVIIYAGALLYRGGALSLGELMAYIALLWLLYRPAREIAEKFAVYQSAMAAGDKIFALADRNQSIPNEGSSLPQRARGEIVFDRVSFAYDKEKPVLTDFSFTLHPSEQVAVVGYTGSGKTTLANLLARLWVPQSGRILLDGVDIKKIQLSSLRRNIVVVDQDVFLFSRSVAENIALGGPFSREQIIEAAKTAQADPFIQKLPQGYDTVLYQRGVNLSRGQRQLVVLARALIHDPPVIVLDEATTSIDSETEQRIQKGTEELLKKRTSLVIAHKLSAIVGANRILVVADGKLVQTGTHKELLAEGGLYENLYRLQFEQEHRGDKTFRFSGQSG